jgi:hypothetical protein
MTFQMAEVWVSRQIFAVTLSLPRAFGHPRPQHEMSSGPESPANDGRSLPQGRQAGAVLRSRAVSGLARLPAVHRIYEFLLPKVARKMDP